MSFDSSLKSFLNRQAVNGLTRKAIAFDLNISLSTLYNYRNGKTAPKGKRLKELSSTILRGSTYGDVVKELRGSMTNVEFEDKFLVSARAMRRYQNRKDRPNGRARLPIRKTSLGYEIDNVQLDAMKTKGKTYKVELDRTETEVWGGDYDIYNELRRSGKFSAVNPQLGLAIKNGYEIRIAIDQVNEQTNEITYLEIVIKPDDYIGETQAESNANLRSILTDKVRYQIDELRRKEGETPPLKFRVSKDFTHERKQVKDYGDTMVIKPQKTKEIDLGFNKDAGF
jgi:transcriptional regulator with XRE-family HTH domain